MIIDLEDILAADVVVARKIEKAASSAGVSIEEFVEKFFYLAGGSTRGCDNRENAK